MARTLTLRKLRTLKVALDAPSFEWILLDLPSRSAACIPILKRTGGVLLGMPEDTFTKEELEAGHVGDELVDLGPHHAEKVAIQMSVVEETLGVLFLDFPESHFNVLQYFPRGTLAWPPGTLHFTDEGGNQVIPEPDELVAVARLWVEGGEARSSDAYHSAMELPMADPHPAATRGSPVLDAVLVQMENLATQFADLKQEVSSLQHAKAPPVAKAGALAAARTLAGPAPSTRRPVQYGNRAGPMEAEAEEVGEDEVPATPSDLDSLLKTALLKLVMPKKKKEIAGVALEYASSDDEDQDPLRKMHLARVTMMQEKHRQAMDHSPQKFVEAIEAHAATVLGLDSPGQDTLERYVREELPVGSDKSLGYLTWGLVRVASLLRSGHHAKAHLITLLLLSAIEQSRLDQNWNAAWRLTHLPVPPFPEWRIRESNLPTLRADNAHCRLLHPTWMATVVARMKGEEVLVRKRGKLQLDRPEDSKGPGKGKRHGGKGKWHSATEKDGENMDTK